MGQLWRPSSGPDSSQGGGGAGGITQLSEKYTIPEHQALPELNYAFHTLRAGNQVQTSTRKTCMTSPILLIKSWTTRTRLGRRRSDGGRGGGTSSGSAFFSAVYWKDSPRSRKNEPKSPCVWSGFVVQGSGVAFVVESRGKVRQRKTPGRAAPVLHFGSWILRAACQTAGGQPRNPSIAQQRTSILWGDQGARRARRSRRC